MTNPTPLLHRQQIALDVSTPLIVVSTKVVCDGPGDERALHVEAATA